MGAVSGIVAGLVTIAGGLAAFRYVERKTKSLRDALEETQRRARGDMDGAVLDYERDPTTGVFKPKS